MTPEEKNILHNKVLARYELYKLAGSRIKRLLKDPIRTAIFYVMQALAYVHPYKVKYTTLWGDKMEFYLPEGSMIYYFGFFEANLTNFLLKFLKEGDVFFDIGAHVGFYSVLASGIVGDNGKVIAFEPTPRTFESLNNNLNGKRNAKAYNNAILDVEKEIEFVDYGPKYSVFNTFKKREDINTAFLGDGIKFKVKTINLDDFCFKDNIFPTFIKIDVEGAEHIILESIPRILKEIMPVISIEVSDCGDLKENSVKSIDLLQSMNYKGYVADVDGNLKEHVGGAEYAYENLIFVHDSKKDTVANIIIK